MLLDEARGEATALAAAEARSPNSTIAIAVLALAALIGMLAWWWSRVQRHGT